MEDKNKIFLYNGIRYKIIYNQNYTILENEKLMLEGWIRENIHHIMFLCKASEFYRKKYGLYFNPVLWMNEKECCRSFYVDIYCEMGRADNPQLQYFNILIFDSDRNYVGKITFDGMPCEEKIKETLDNLIEEGLVKRENGRYVMVDKSEGCVIN